MHPDRIRPNNGGHAGDKLILTKPLGVGLACTAARAGAPDGLPDAIRSMTTLNRYAAEAADRYEIHACTDVTGFGLAGHLREMLRPDLTARVQAAALPHLQQARQCAEEFYLTAAAQRNRNAAEGHIRFRGADFATEELVFDPQTSGGLLFAVAAADATARVQAAALPHLQQARQCVEEFYLTAAAQRSRNAAEGHIRFRGADFATEELVFDPQTSGGLLFAVAAADADALLRDVQALGLPCGIIGELMPRVDMDLIVEGTI